MSKMLYLASVLAVLQSSCDDWQGDTDVLFDTVSEPPSDGSDPHDDADVPDTGVDPDVPADTGLDVSPSSDEDGDTISDLDEGRLGAVDTDRDGTPDYLDEDSDGDTIPDRIEAGDADLFTDPVDTDLDFNPDFRDLDSDADGLPDDWENEHGTNPRDEDTDIDGIPDIYEVGARTDPLDPSSNARTEGIWLFVMHFGEESDPVLDHIVLGLGTDYSDWATIEFRDDPSDAVDTVAAFIDYAEPSTAGGWSDLADPGRICESVSSMYVSDRVSPFDGTPDSFVNLMPDMIVCFDVWTIRNTTVPEEWDPQSYLCEMDMVTEDGLQETRHLAFLVPTELYSY
jgi:hypothetical protein